MSVTTPPCRVCGNATANRLHYVREMMFGTGECFPYFECSTCASLQILDVPQDLSPYYPDDYLGAPPKSSQATAPAVPHRTSTLRLFLNHQRLRYTLYGRNPLGWLLSKIFVDYRKAEWDSGPYPWEWFRRARVQPTSRILDVGCGTGVLLWRLKRQGFTNLTGHDLFQKRRVQDVNILDCPLNKMEGVFDLIMLHHSFEHMPDALGTLHELKRLCSRQGVILIRLPLADCLAWKEYGTDWYQIDAPRHLVIPSRKGMDILAERAGLDIVGVTFDSDAKQFCCSEQYRQGIPLRDPRSYESSHAGGSLFSAAQLESFRAKTDEANATGQGDQACFYLRPRRMQDMAAAV